MTIDPARQSEVASLANEISDDGGTLERLERLAEMVGDRVSQVKELVKAREAEGAQHSSVVVLQLPRADVAKLLPLGLEIAPSPLSTPDTHPVVVMFSHESLDLPGDLAYQAVSVGVPYVQLSTWKAPRRGPFIYMPRLYVDSEVAQELGNHLYGYEDQLATVDQAQPADGQAGHSRVTDPGSGTMLLEATLIPEGDAAPASSFASFAELRQLFEMPIISQASRIWNDDAFSSDDLSPMLASTWMYDFDADTTTVRPISVVMRIDAALTPPGIPPGQYHSPSLDNAYLGAFAISCRRRVTLPGSPATVRYPVPTPARRQKVVVLGGGPSACAAAYWLAKQTDRYEVHMYTLGWRLGGKCAAGRNPRADMRIEEHGLHAFLGFYENAIRTVRDAWATAGIPISDGDQPLGGAFIGSTHNGLMIERKKQWRYYPTPLPLNDRIPGEVPPEAADDDATPPSSDRRRVKQSHHGLGQMMIGLFEWLGLLVTGRHEAVDARRSGAGPDAGTEGGEHEGDGLLARLRHRGEEAVRRIESEVAELLRSMVRYVEDVAALTFEEWLAEGPDGPLRHLRRLVVLARHIMNGVVDIFGDDDEVWYVWMNVNSMLTVALGIIDDRVAHLDQLDGVDTWEWLISHGLDQRLVPEDLRSRPVRDGQEQGSPAVAAVYETLFAHGADAAVPRDMAASVGIRWMLLTGFGYAGFPAYEFKYSCPQTLLTPYYRALTEKLGAKIHFFHQVTGLKVEGEGAERRLAGIRLRKQATVEGGSDAYRPFLPNPPANNPADLPPWPIEPNYDQLVEGERLRAEGIDLESPWSPWPGVEDVELERGQDFDLCVLGISLGALAPLTEVLWKDSSPTHDPRWTRMIHDIAITQTISMQLWFDANEAQLYEGQRGLLTEYVLPEPSMSNFTHLVQWEGWPNPPKFLAYHTGSLTAKSVLDHPPFSDHEYPARANAEWVEQARAWTRENHAAFYDAAPGDWSDFTKLLSLPSGADPSADRFAAQYFNAAVNMSDRYVLSQPKGMPARMGQMDSGVRDLFLCGDWTDTDMNCGCVEAATQSGMLCARGISQHPVYVWHPGF